MGSSFFLHAGYRTAASILKRVRTLFKKLGLDDFSRVHMQAIGEECLYGANARKLERNQIRETAIWLAVEHKDKKALQLFSMEIAAAGTGGYCLKMFGRTDELLVLPGREMDDIFHADNFPCFHCNKKLILSLGFQQYSWLTFLL